MHGHAGAVEEVYAVDVVVDDDGDEEDGHAEWD